MTAVPDARMASSRAAFAVALATLVGAFAAIDPARAFGAGAGSCEHLGVGHGVESSNRRRESSG